MDACATAAGRWSVTAVPGAADPGPPPRADTYRDAMGLPRTSVLAASRPAPRGGQADYPRTVPATGTARAGRQHRSEGWTIIVTAAEGRQGSDWARWLLRQARAG